MFYICRKLTINDNVNLPIDEINFNSVSLIDCSGMCLYVDMTYVPKMFSSASGNESITTILNRYNILYGFIFRRTGIFKTSAEDFSVDLSIQYCSSVNDFERMMGNDVRPAKIRYKFDETDENEIAHENQISALVQETTPGSPSAYFIYPRYAGDDLISNKIFLKHPQAYSNGSGIWLMFTWSQYITRYADSEFKIIFEDISQPILQEYDYKKFITTYNDSHSGMSYVENSYNENTKTFRLQYTHLDGKIYQTIYSFYSMFPSAFINVTDNPSQVVNIEINDYINYYDSHRGCSYIPIEESLRYNLKAKSHDIGWNLPDSSIRIFPNEKTSVQTYTYLDTAGKQQTKSFNISDYYQKLHLQRTEAVSINDSKHTSAPCVSYILDTFEKVFLEHEKYTETDLPIKDYLKHLVLDENNYTLGLSGITKMVKEQTGVTVTQLGGLGYDRPYITHVPATFKIPDGITYLNYLFCNTRITKLDYPLILPSSVTLMSYFAGSNPVLEDLSNLDRK